MDGEIVVCDDDKEFHVVLEKKIRTYFMKYGIDYEIHHYYSGKELLESDIREIKLIFLDIKLAEMNGIEVAAALRKKNPDFVLVFISTLLEYATYGYEVNALRYILKDQLNVVFNKTMAAAIERLGCFRMQISFDFVGGAADVYTDEILFFEGRLHQVHLHFLNSNKCRYLYKETLNSIEKRLPPDEFIRIHQSFLTNLRYFIDTIDHKAIFHNGITLQISPNKYTAVKKQLFKYRGTI